MANNRASRQGRVERHRVRVAFRVPLAFVIPAVTLVACYVVFLLVVHSSRGNAWLIEQIDAALPGRVEVGRLALGGNPFDVTLYDVHIADPAGHEVVAVDAASCTLRPWGLFDNRLQFDDCEVAGGEVTLDVASDRPIGLDSAFVGAFATKSTGSGPTIVFSDIKLSGVAFLMQFHEALIRLDHIEAIGAKLHSGAHSIEVKVDQFDVGGGRILLTEAALGLGPGKRLWAQSEWDARRRVRPWETSREPAPATEGRLRGVLDLPLTRATFRDFVWRDHGFGFSRAQLRLGRDSLTASGWLEVLSDTPKVPPRESVGMRFDGSTTISLEATSPLLQFALPETFDGAPGQTLTASGHGTLSFFEGTVGLRLRDIVALRQPLDEVEASMRFSQGRMTFETPLRVRGWGGEVTATGWWVPTDGTWRLDACVRDLSLGRLLAPYLKPASLALVEGAVVQVGGERCDPAKGPLHAWGDLTVKTTHGYSHSGQPDERSALQPMLSVDTDAFSLAWTERQPLPPRELRGRVAAVIDPRGWIGLTSPDRAWAVDLSGGGTSVRANGRWDLTQVVALGLDVEVKLDDLRRWRPDLAWADRVEVTAQGSLAGDVLIPDTFDLATTLSRTAEAGGAFDANARLRRVGDRLIVEDATYVSARGSVSGSGSLGLFAGRAWRPDAPLDLRLELRDVLPERWVVNSPVRGSVDATLEVLGTSRKPVLRGPVRGVGLDIVGEAVPLLTLDLDVDNEDVRLASIEAECMGGRVVGDVRLVGLPTPQLSGRLVARGLDLATSTGLAATGVHAAGIADLDLTIGGSSDAPDLGGSAIISQFAVAPVAPQNLNVTFDTRDGVLEGWGEYGGMLELAGAWRWASQTLRIEATADRLDPRLLAPALRSTLDGAVVSGTFVFDTDESAGSQKLAVLNLSEASITALGHQVRNRSPLEVAWSRPKRADGSRDDVVTLNGSVGAAEDVVTVDASLLNWRDLDAHAFGALDLSLLRLLPTLVSDAEGVAELSKLRVHGPLRALHYDGDVRIRRGRIVPASIDAVVELEGGLVRLVDGRLQLPASDPVRGRVWGGDVELSGTYDLVGPEPGRLDLAAAFRDVSYRVPGQMALTLSGEVEVRAANAIEQLGWSVSGDIELIEGRYFKDFAIVEQGVGLGASGRVVGALELPLWRRNPLVGGIEADLRIRGRDRLRVESNLASAVMRIELKTDLTVRGRLRDMVVEGQMKALEGSRVNYRGREFSVESATLDFDGRLDAVGLPSPLLDASLVATVKPCGSAARTLLAETTGGFESVNSISTVTITAKLEGRAPAAVTYELSSTPSYDQRDQLSLLLTGCTVDELTASSAGAPTLDVVFRPVLDLVERNVEERLDFDAVNLIPTETGSAEITIQDQPTERLVWSLSASLGGSSANTQSAQGVFRLFDWLSIDLKEQTDGGGLSLEAGLRVRAGAK